MSQVDLQEAIKALQEQIHVLQQSQKREVQRASEGKLPVELSRKVKAVYNSTTENFELHEPFKAPVNSVVTDLIITAIRDETEYDAKLVRRAVQRFYEGRRRLCMYSAEKKKVWGDRKKLRSRRERLYNIRRKYAQGDEVDVLMRAHPDLMSDEESDGEELVLRSPAWRERGFGQLLHDLDQRMVEKRRSQGLTLYCSRKRRRGPESERERSSVVCEEFLESVSEEDGRDRLDFENEDVSSVVEREQRVSEVDTVSVTETQKKRMEQERQKERKEENRQKMEEERQNESRVIRKGLKHLMKQKKQGKFKLH